MDSSLGSGADLPSSAILGGRFCGDALRGHAQLRFIRGRTHVVEGRVAPLPEMSHSTRTSFRTPRGCGPSCLSEAADSPIRDFTFRPEDAYRHRSTVRRQDRRLLDSTQLIQYGCR
jgi:hypothetical protein